MQPAVDTPGQDQIGMAALFGQAGLVHHNDTVGALDGGETVGDDQGGAAPGQFEQALLDRPLGFGVERGSRFVQDQNRRVLQEHPRNGQALLLAAGQFHPPLADDRVHAVGHVGDGFLQASTVRGVDDVGFGSAEAAIGDVVADGAREQEHVLLDNADLATQRGQRHRADVDAVDGDTAAFHVVEAWQQGADRGLAGA